MIVHIHLLFRNMRWKTRDIGTWAIQDLDWGFGSGKSLDYLGAGPATVAIHSDSVVLWLHGVDEVNRANTVVGPTWIFLAGCSVRLQRTCKDGFIYGVHSKPLTTRHVTSAKPHQEFDKSFTTRKASSGGVALL